MLTMLIRKHYTECVVYWGQLVAGSLHHACVSGPASLCGAHTALLLYSDSLTELLSVWVTVLAMAYLPHSLRSVLHITGGLVITTLARLHHGMVSYLFQL